MKLYISILLTIICSSLIYSQTDRPQDPKEPHNYTSENVYFMNFEADSIKLSGTLTLPKKQEKTSCCYFNFWIWSSK